MDREIKFRAWDKEEKKMYEVSAICFLNKVVDIFRWENIPGQREKVRVSNFDMKYPDRVILMQFTGIKDKNGVEIYEDDIVKCHKFTQELGENLGVVEGEKEFIAKIVFSIYGGTQVALSSEEYIFVWEYEEGWHEESLEVIGNTTKDHEAEHLNLRAYHYINDIRNGTPI